MELLKFIIYSISFVIGVQISKGDLKLLKGKIEYKLRLSNYVAYLCALLGFVLIGVDIYTNGMLLYIGAVMLSFGAAIVGTWIISNINSKSFLLTLTELAAGFFLFFLVLDLFLLEKMSIPFIMGLYWRNNPLGAPFIKKFLLLQNYEKPQCVKIRSDEYTIGAIDYNYAGQKKSFERLRLYNVMDFGINPDVDEDALPKVQKMIDAIGKTGGIVYFPKGRYYFNRNRANRNFLRINTSHIHIQGEVDEQGTPVSVLVNCNSTLYGKKNPWLSPFFITTGENIQASNIFWGLQFLKKKNIVTKSLSMSDPGSDGTILTPEYCTDIIQESKIGDDI